MGLKQPETPSFQGLGLGAKSGRSLFSGKQQAVHSPAMQKLPIRVHAQQYSLFLPFDQLQGDWVFVLFGSLASLGRVTS